MWRRMKNYDTSRIKESVMIEMHYGGRLGAHEVRKWRIKWDITDLSQYAHQATYNLETDDMAIAMSLVACLVVPVNPGPFAQAF